MTRDVDSTRSMGADDPIPDAPPATGHATADSDHSAADQGQPVEQQPTDDYLATVDRLSFASWGDGSHPSLPSIAGSETTFVSAAFREHLALGTAGD